MVGFFVLFCYLRKVKYKGFKVNVSKFLAFIFLPLLSIKFYDIISRSLSLIGFSAFFILPKITSEKFKVWLTLKQLGY